MKRKSKKKGRNRSSRSSRVDDNKLLNLYHRKLERLRANRIEKSSIMMAGEQPSLVGQLEKVSESVARKVNVSYSPIKPIRIQSIPEYDSDEDDMYYPTPRDEDERSKKANFSRVRVGAKEVNLSRQRERHRKASRRIEKSKIKSKSVLYPRLGSSQSDTMIKRSRFHYQKDKNRIKKRIKKKKKKKKKSVKMNTQKDCILLNRKGNRIRLKIDVYEPKKIDLVVVDHTTKRNSSGKRRVRRKRIVVERKRPRRKRKRSSLSTKRKRSRVNRNRRKLKYRRRSGSPVQSDCSDTSVKRRVRLRRGRRMIGTMITTRKIVKK